MCITTNEKYSCWVHTIFEHVQNWLSLSLSLLEWPGMTRNDHPNKRESSIRPHSAVSLGHDNVPLIIKTQSSLIKQQSTNTCGVDQGSGSGESTHVAQHLGIQYYLDWCCSLPIMCLSLSKRDYKKYPIQIFILSADMIFVSFCLELIFSLFLYSSFQYQSRIWTVGLLHFYSVWIQFTLINNTIWILNLIY